VQSSHLFGFSEQVAKNRGPFAVKERIVHTVMPCILARLINRSIVRKLRAFDERKNNRLLLPNKTLADGR
jgi:hypothetical protein